MVATLQSRTLPDQADFHAAIAERGDRWYSACLSITRDRGLAEDAVQDALLSAWNKRSQFDGKARLSTWIHRIAINAALRLLRKGRPGVFEPLDADVADTAAAPDELTERTELGGRLAQALTGLSPFERICFVLRHLEDWRLAEIAEEIETSPGAVKQAIFRAVRKLRHGEPLIESDRS